jgi:hypothetical protein
MRGPQVLIGAPFDPSPPIDEHLCASPSGETGGDPMPAPYRKILESLRRVSPSGRLKG